MRQIKASEIKPGMTIRWGRWDISYQCTLTRVERFNGGPGVQGETRQGKTVFLRGDDDVLVVKEPEQPEEPTTFGARAVVKGRRFLRSPEDKCDVQAWLEEGDGIWRDWDELCAMGPVQVIPDQGWTAPDDGETTPEVPDRIEEWGTWDDVPERVVVTTPGLFCHYRKNQGVIEFSDPEEDPDWTKAGVRDMPRGYGPWTRDTDDTPEVPDRIDEWPEDDEALRAHVWRDRDGGTWKWLTTASAWECYDEVGYYLQSGGRPSYGPWTRVTDA